MCSGVKEWSIFFYKQSFEYRRQLQSALNKKLLNEMFISDRWNDLPPAMFAILTINAVVTTSHKWEAATWNCFLHHLPPANDK